MLRLIFFPFWIIKSTSVELQEVLDVSKVYDRSLFYVFNTMLLMLLVFHIYWWFLICSMILRQLRNRGRVGEDVRSDSEDE
uniref:TLC domain-containing protein n=1 Tax=Rhizophora mucronata TaxID=61149 RepID=A0A2P2P2L5_RHIMU